MKKKEEKQYTYDQVAGVLMVIGIASLWLASTWNMDNQINDLKLEMQQQSDSLNCTIDS